MTLKADAVLNNTMISQFYVLFNFLCGKSVLHKRAAEENVEKVDSFHIYILASAWKWTNYQWEPKEKLGKPFRKLIFWQALPQKCSGNVLLWLQTPSSPAGLGSLALVLVPLQTLWSLGTALERGLDSCPKLQLTLGLGPQHDLKPNHEQELKAKVKTKTET